MDTQAVAAGWGPVARDAAGGAEAYQPEAAAWDLSRTRTSTPPTVDLVQLVAAHHDRESAVPAGLIVLAILTFAFLVSMANGEFGWSAGLALTAAAAGALVRQTARLDHAGAALSCSHLGKRYVGAMCDALEAPDGRVRRTAALMLISVLPQLGADDDALLIREQRNCLYRRIAPRTAHRDPALTVAILHALPFIGSEGALPHVQKLANRVYLTNGGYRISMAAKAALPLLEERVARQRAEAAARRSEPPDAAETALSDEEQRQQAAHAAAADTAMKEFEAELRRVPKPGMRLGFLVASWGIIVPYTAFQTVQRFTLGDWPLGLLFALLTILSTQLYRLTLTGKHKQLAERLNRVDDVRSIGRLTELLEWPDTAVQSIAIGALTRLLPRVKASDRVLHTDAQRSVLYRQLTLSRAGRYSEFVVAILKALEQIGDDSAVPHVLGLVNAQPSSARERRVCDAASDCLPYLQHRAKATRGSDMLLRASAPTSAGADALLRAADSGTATDPQQLLRADTGEGSR